MPTYGYECKSCAHSFDYFQNIKDDPLKICPECGKELRRLITGGTGVIFKGNGFYVTDKSSKSGKSGPAASSTEKPKTESSPCANCPAKEPKTESGAINGGTNNGGAATGGCPKASGS